MFFRFSDDAKRDTERALEIIEHLNNRPKPPRPKNPDTNWENYQFGLGEWKNNYLEDYDSMERMIKQIAPGDLDRQQDLICNKTHTQVAEAFAEIIMLNN